MRLYVDLSHDEETDLYAWVLLGRSDPAFAAHPTRVVLSERTQARFDQIAAQFLGTTPVPGDPIAAFRARQAVSQNCAWVLLTSQEHGALADAYGIDVVKKYVEFYTVGGSGALGVNEQPMGGGYSFVKNDQWVPDLNQAADAYVQEQATAQGRTVPAPLP